jgi:hypothetical protein
MQIVSAREFRANQGKFLNAAKEGKTNETLTEGICESLREVKMIREGKIKGKKAEDLLNEL